MHLIIVTHRWQHLYSEKTENKTWDTAAAQRLEHWSFNQENHGSNRTATTLPASFSWDNKRWRYHLLCYGREAINSTITWAYAWPVVDSQTQSCAAPVVHRMGAVARTSSGNGTKCHEPQAFSLPRCFWHWQTSPLYAVFWNYWFLAKPHVKLPHYTLLIIRVACYFS